MHLLSDVARRYFADDLPGATVRGARLQGVLQTIDDGRTLSAYSLAFLEKQGLLSLGSLARGVISPEEFRRAAAAEQSARVAEAVKRAMVAEKQAAESASAIQAHFAKNDPVRRKRREARQLRERFGIGYVDAPAYARVMELLKRIEGGGRLSPQEVIWLSTDADCWTPQVRTAYHRLEATALTDEWQRTADPWAAINACSHWRKAEVPEQVIKLTTALLGSPDLSAKIRSALNTTRGGALRDLGRMQEASGAGQEAHRLSPSDFRPCTLLGAISMTQGDFAAGYKWYAMAEELGAEPRAVDQDIRGVLHRCAPATRLALTEFLVASDPDRFAWVRGMPHERTTRSERVVRT